MRSIHSRFAAAALLALMLITAVLPGCTPPESTPGNTPEQTLQPAPTATAAPEAEPSAAPEPTESAEPVAADRHSEIFDRSNDDGKLTVRFLNVVKYDNNGLRLKTGDHMVLTSPDGKVMLIDAGLPSAGPYIVDMLKELGITYIDYFIISHMHGDHNGGVPSILENFGVGQMYMNADLTDGDASSRYYNAMMQAIETFNVPCERVWEGFTFSFGEYVQAKIYNPPEDYDYTYRPEGVDTRNNSSLAMRLVYNESSFLFCGDCYYESETRMVEKYGDELKSGFAKMNHHGYDQSNTLNWVRTISPLASVGTYSIEKSKYLAYLSVDGAPFFTYADGEIYVSTAGDGEYLLITQLDRNHPLIDCDVPADGRYVFSESDRG